MSELKYQSADFIDRLRDAFDERPEKEQLHFLIQIAIIYA